MDFSFYLFIFLYFTVFSSLFCELSVSNSNYIKKNTKYIFAPYNKKL